MSPHRRDKNSSVLRLKRKTELEQIKTLVRINSNEINKLLHKLERCWALKYADYILIKTPQKRPRWVWN